MKVFEKKLGIVAIHPEGEWVADKKYTRLSLVTHPDVNVSFVAKKNVPKNISPISSEKKDEYWFRIGNGATISIDEETNTWIINGVDSGIQATGDTGAKGDKGDKGDSGDITNATSLGFSHDVMYNPSDEYNTHILIKQSDDTDAAAEFPTIETKTEDDYTYNLITAKLKNEVAQKETALNAFFPIAIAGRAYNNMVSGNCLPIYYASGLELNPVTGVIRVSNVAIKDPDNPNNYITITDLLTRYIGNIETLLAAL